MVAFWCGNPSFSVSRLVAVVIFTYTRIMEFWKFMKEKSEKNQGVLLKKNASNPVKFQVALLTFRSPPTPVVEAM